MQTPISPSPGKVPSTAANASEKARKFRRSAEISRSGRLLRDLEHDSGAAGTTAQRRSVQISLIQEQVSYRQRASGEPVKHRLGSSRSELEHYSARGRGTLDGTVDWPKACRAVKISLPVANQS